MRRDVSSHGYGTCTAQQLYRFAEALGADRKPWVQAYCLIVGASKRGSALGDVESAWLEDWISREGMALEPREAIVSQFSIGELADFFGGQKTIALRALDELRNRGLIEQIAKGRKGHSSLFLVGDIRYTKKQRKRAPKAKNIQDTFSNDRVHVFDELGDKRDSVTSGNDDVSIVNQSISKRSEPLPTTKESYERVARNEHGRCFLCVICGARVGRDNRLGRFECPSCNCANVTASACKEADCGICNLR